MSKYLAFFLPAIINYSVFYLWSDNAGDIAFIYATTAFIFIVIPLIDLILSRNSFGFINTLSQKKISEAIIVLLSLPLQIWNIYFFAWYIGTHDLAAYQIAMTLLVAGILSALYAQNPAHELIHHRTIFERTIGAILFSTCIYSGAKLAHIHSHHLLVATNSDPTSAKYNQSLYQFLPGAISINLFGWWGHKMQSTRHFFASNKKVIFENMLGYGLSLGWLLSIFYLFGAKSLSFFIFQSFIAILVLEMMNYIGHYGLERKVDVNGKMETVTEIHAWDCDLPFSNLVLISVQKHAEHHINPNKSYGALKCVNNSPRLPLSYPLLFILTLFPFLWRKVIHPRLDAYHAQWKQELNQQ